MRKILKLGVMTLFLTTPLNAQFAPPGNKKPVIRKQISKPKTLIEQQREWVIQATRTELARIEKLPRSAGVNANVQQAITNYAPSNGFGYARDWNASDCENSIGRAEKKFNLPPYLLVAIALTESGIKGKPSPFALNISGKSYYPNDTSEMKALISRNGGSTSSIDVGCLQINLKWHAPRFKNWESLLVPNYNAEYAALYLTELHRKYGNWSSAVGAYHSRTPWRSENYACLVSRRWSQIFGSERSGCGANIDAMASYMYQTQR